MTALTRVELVWVNDRIENRIRFAPIAEQHVLDRSRQLVSFEPGSLFAFVRWASNDSGTIFSRIDICAPLGKAAIFLVPGVRPGGEILLRLAGWRKIVSVLKAIGIVEVLGIDPVDAAPEHWRNVHNRLFVNKRPRSYTQRVDRPGSGAKR